MPSKPGCHVVKFVMLDFIGKWGRSKENLGDTLMEYVSLGQGCTLFVVSEEAGALFTESYDLPIRSSVWVVDQVVHIPVRRPKRTTGNQVYFQ